MNDAAKGLEDADVQMPSFGNLGRDLAKEMKEETEEESNILITTGIAREKAESLKKLTEHIKNNLEPFKKCQLHIRRRLEHRKSSAIKIQKVFKGHAVRRVQNEKLTRFKSHEDLFKKVSCA